MYSSSTKNWFHTQPLLTRWYLFAPFLIGPAELLACSLPFLLCPRGGNGGREEKTEPSSTRIQRNSSRQFLVSIGGLWGFGPVRRAEPRWKALRRLVLGIRWGRGLCQERQTQRAVFPGPVSIRLRDLWRSSPAGRKHTVVKISHGLPSHYLLPHNIII